LPVRGADARALGIDKGPRVGEALRALETWWVENDFAPTREACLEKLRGLV
jgi:poly(A) polymerase